MPHYPDKRANYVGIASWEVAKIENAIPAIRESTPSRLFRSTTAEISEEPQITPTIPNPTNIMPPEKDIEL